MRVKQEKAIIAGIDIDTEEFVCGVCEKFNVKAPRRRVQEDE
jgi:hypothetical protein